MGQVVPTVLARRRPRLVGLKEHLPDVFVRSAEELLQGLVLGPIEPPQIASPALAWKDPANKHHLDHIDELDVFIHHALDALCSAISSSDKDQFRPFSSKEVSRIGA